MIDIVKDDADFGSMLGEVGSVVNSHDVVLYMKGSPDFPRCGFSAVVAKILRDLKVNFVSYDVLADSSLREAVKKFMNWPTFPQLYVKGELVGGCDIVREMHESGELLNLFESKGLVG